MRSTIFRHKNCHYLNLQYREQQMSASIESIHLVVDCGASLGLGSNLHHQKWQDLESVLIHWTTQARLAIGRPGCGKAATPKKNVGRAMMVKPRFADYAVVNANGIRRLVIPDTVQPLFGKTRNLTGKTTHHLIDTRCTTWGLADFSRTSRDRPTRCPTPLQYAAVPPAAPFPHQ